jgi:hypothetical protein
MKDKFISLTLMALMLVSGVSAYSLQGSYSLRSTEGTLLNIAHFTNFAFQKTSVSVNGRFGNLSNYEYSGSGGFEVLGVTSGGNRVSVNMNGDLMYLEDSQSSQTAQYIGYATFKTGSLLPKRYTCLVTTYLDKLSNTMDVDASCCYFGGFKIRDMKVESLI